MSRTAELQHVSVNKAHTSDCTSLLHWSGPQWARKSSKRAGHVCRESCHDILHRLVRKLADIMPLRLLQPSLSAAHLDEVLWSLLRLIWLWDEWGSRHLQILCSLFVL